MVTVVAVSEEWKGAGVGPITVADISNETSSIRLGSVGSFPSITE